MKSMRFHPPGFGGERRSVEEVKRDGWHEQGVASDSLKIRVRSSHCLSHLTA